MNFLKIYCESKNSPSEKIINSACEYFFNNYIFEMVCKEFVYNKVSKKINLEKKLIGISTLEGNFIEIPIEQVCEIINFTNNVENEQVFLENDMNTSIKINKFTDILSGNFVDNQVKPDLIKEINESDLIDFIVSKTKSITENIKIVDNKIRITFN